MEGAVTIGRKDVELEDGRLPRPGAADSGRSESRTGIVEMQLVDVRPPRAAVNGVMDDLAIHFLPVLDPQRENGIGRGGRRASAHGA
jgi:hypothetical protein